MSDSVNKTILLMAGGTGGHIFPALAVGKHLQQQGWKLHWLGSEGGMEEELVPKHGIRMTLLPVKGIRKKGLTSLLKAPFQLLNSVLKARAVIKKVKPDVALGMGGFASGPGGIAAKLCGVPLVLHEQNAIAGMTNSYLNRLSNITLQAYPGAFDNSNKLATVGNPVRTDLMAIANAEQRIHRDNGTIKILVIGGSRGAMILNQKVPAMLDIINGGLNVDVRHQCGRGNLGDVAARYKQIKNQLITHDVTEFIEDMAEAYSWADLVICRAGALTVAEIAAAGCAAIFVPYPHAVDDHQTHNARYLASQGAALIIQQHDLDETVLAQQVTSLANDKEHLIEMAAMAKKLAKPYATEQVADYCKRAAIGDYRIQKETKVTTDKDTMPEDANESR
ncbi:undecaprenyldiphospho-muramoylpentapeptide beta-N-acetylglucosaminyltransferase [Kangiella sediminilitoris]|uniref:UDP-N-acetylglucosamine--N-acetylmuramyl-(pentapeptide) pyrophosphoryl-undecaprenol N-acetylglucosamine transferase n=1 Tax=Kangiella sediminilitoris TaxID=1144748 RepID=A0A1B3BCH9_9GAMM|nr:undecaprenyldiphospho-muramoylpentapeptide beta-N-acetylglucosaminyltransferase [Kangiella sediminilitoris]AOE50465.1 UDP-N-acetylglucosamine--N-acetylmuramyl-(pentapeptide) pyrophosphoryl-undecaprenol N-acetylglucosamine transferase [Kangiella sediminilitoris]